MTLQRKIRAVWSLRLFTPRHWKNLVKALKIENEVREIENNCGLDLTLEADRWAARDDIISAIGPRVEAMALAEVRVLLDEHGVCWGPYQTFLASSA